jgi:hypothetical protein
MTQFGEAGSSTLDNAGSWVKKARHPGKSRPRARKGLVTVSNRRAQLPVPLPAHRDSSEDSIMPI